MSIFFNQDLFVGVVREHLVLDMAAIDPRYLMVVVKIHEDSNQILWRFWWYLIWNHIDDLVLVSCTLNLGINIVSKQKYKQKRRINITNPHFSPLVRPLCLI